MGDVEEKQYEKILEKEKTNKRNKKKMKQLLKKCRYI